MSAISDEVEDEFSDLGREASRLTEFIAGLDRKGLVEDTLTNWVATHVGGSSAEKLYMGMERIMLLLATGVDRGALEKTSSWHLHLLRRMGEPVEGRRAAILTAGLCAALDRLRAFRHRERNSYAADLRPVTVVQRAEEAVATLARFQDEVRAFLRSLPP